MSNARRSKRPIDRLTRLCDAMKAALVAQPEHDDSVRAVIMLNDGKRAGIAMHGYDDETAALAAVIIHLQAIFEANGKTLMVMPLGQN